MPSLINKLAVKNTVMLKTGMWCRKDISLKCRDDSPLTEVRCGDDSSFTEDLIRVLSLQVIT